METSKIVTEYTQILKGSSRIEKVLILLFTIMLYVGHTRTFIFLFHSLFIYPLAVLLYLKGSGAVIFAGSVVIHLTISEGTCLLWSDRKTVMNYQKAAMIFVLNTLKSK